MRIPQTISIFLFITGFCLYLIALGSELGRQNAGSAIPREISLSASVQPGAISWDGEASSEPTSSVQPLEIVEDTSVLTLLPEEQPLAPERTGVADPHPPISLRTIDLNAQQPASYREIWAIVTAYCPCRRCCGHRARGITSTGKSAWTQGVAADPRAVPYGTLVEIPGYGMYRIDDTGGAMRRSWRRRGMVHLDIRMKYHWSARQWGRKMMRVRIYE